MHAKQDMLVQAMQIDDFIMITSQLNFSLVLCVSQHVHAEANL